MTSTIDALNRLSVVHSRSLATYLNYATPWIPANKGEAGEALRQIAEDNQTMADRIGTMILDANEAVDPGEYPLKYTALNDLSFDYLLQLLLEYQRHLIATTQECAEQLNLAPMARSVAEEALGEAKGHLEILEEFAANPTQP